MKVAGALVVGLWALVVGLWPLVVGLWSPGLGPYLVSSRPKRA